MEGVSEKVARGRTAAERRAQSGASSERGRLWLRAHSAPQEPANLRRGRPRTCKLLVTTPFLGSCPEDQAPTTEVKCRVSFKGL